MPELPEVEIVVRGLAPLVSGRRVRKVEVFDSKLALRPDDLPQNSTICTVTRSAKETVFHLVPPGKRKPSLWLCVHLRMTGRLIWSDAPAVDRHRHLRAHIILDRGSLSFFDSRRFGILRLLRDLNGAFPSGIDPLGDGFTLERLSELLDGSRQQIKPWLMRQDRLAGLGNLYASEILHAAQLSPFRMAGELDWVEVERLHRVTRRLLERAIRHCGTTFSDFQDSRGQSGRFRRYLNVYDREGKPCHRCRMLVVRVVQQGRSTYYCPKCQRVGRISRPIAR